MDIKSILNIAFYSVIGFVVIGFLLGLWKGIWKTSFKLFFNICYFTVCIFTAPYLMRWIGNIDFSGMFSFSLDINSVHIQFTSILETVTNIITAIGGITGTTLKTAQEVAGELAMAICSFLLFFIEVILSLILGKLLAILLYHCAFKFIIPKKVRKEHKVRWAGALVGTINSILVSVMFISPLSSVGRLLTANQEVLRNAKKFLSNEQYDQILEIIAAAGDSYIFKSLDLMKIGGKGIDQLIINKVTEMTIQGEKMFLFDELQGIINIVGPLAEAAQTVGGVAGGAIDYLSMIGKDTVSKTLDSLIESNFLLSLLPVVIEFGLELTTGKDDSVIPDGLVDFSDIVWSSEISLIKDFYNSLYDAEVVTAILNKEFTFTRSGQTALNHAIDSLMSTDSFKRNLPSLLAFAATKMGDNSILSTNKEDYKDVDFGREFKLLLDLVLQVVDNDISIVIGGDGAGLETITDKLMSLVTEKPEVVNRIIVGNETSLGLLDSTIIQKSMNGLMSTVLKSASGIDQYINIKEIEELTVNYTVKQWKNEFGAIIDLSAKILGNPNLPISDPASFDLANPLQVAAVKDVIQITSNSEIISIILPNVTKVLVTAAFPAEGIFGLTVEKFDFNPTNFQEVVCDLLDVASDALELAKSFSAAGTDMISMIKGLNMDSVTNILSTLQLSKIVNPGTDNENFNALITGLFSQPAMEQLGVSVPDNINTIVWQGEEGEFKKMNIALKTIQTEAIKFFGTEGINLRDISGASIEAIFTNLSGSVLFGSSLPSILNKNVSLIVQSLGLTLDFNDVTDWDKEGKAFGRVVDGLNSFDKDVANIDWVNEDTTKTNGILTALKTTQVLGNKQNEQGEWEDRFGSFTYDIISKATGSYLGNMNKEDFQEIYPNNTSKEWAWSMTVDEKGITTSGEIYAICQLLTDVQAAGKIENPDLPKNALEGDGTYGLRKITSSKVANNELRQVLYTVNDSEILMNAVPKMISTTITSLPSVDGVSFNDVNVETFEGYNKTERREEIDILLDLYTVSVDGKLDSLMNDPSNLSDESIASVDMALTSMAKLSFFNSLDSINSQDQTKSPIFDQFILRLMDVTNLDLKIANTTDKSAARIIVKRHINRIDDWATAGGEVDRIIDVLRAVKGIDLASISDPTSFSADKVKPVLTAINRAHVTHPAVPALFGDIFAAIKIETMTLGVAINANVHDGLNDQGVLEADTSYWDNEISQIDKLFSTLSGEGGLIDLSGIKLDGSNSIYKFLEPIDKMQLFAETKQNIVYTMLEKASMSTYIRGTTPLAKAEQIKISLFNDQIEKECQSIDNLIAVIKDNLSASFAPGADVENPISSAIPFNAIMTTYVFEGAEVYQAKLTREILSGFLDRSFENIFGADEVKDPELNQEYIYNHINIAEARGIQGLISFSSIFGKSNAEIIQILKNTTRLLGIETITGFSEYTDAQLAYNQLYIDLLTTDEYSYLAENPLMKNNHNSLIGHKLFKKYSSEIKLTLKLEFIGNVEISIYDIITQEPDLLNGKFGLGIDISAPEFNFEKMGINLTTTINPLLP